MPAGSNAGVGTSAAVPVAPASALPPLLHIHALTSGAGVLNSGIVRHPYAGAPVALIAPTASASGAPPLMTAAAASVVAGGAPAGSSLLASLMVAVAAGQHTVVQPAPSLLSGVKNTMEAAFLDTHADSCAALSVAVDAAGLLAAVCERPRCAAALAASAPAIVGGGATSAHMRASASTPALPASSHIVSSRVSGRAGADASAVGNNAATAAAGEDTRVAIQISVYHLHTHECLRTFTYRITPPAGGTGSGAGAGAAAKVDSNYPRLSGTVGGGFSSSRALLLTERGHTTTAVSGSAGAQYDFVRCAFSACGTYIVGYASAPNGDGGVLVLFKWKSKKVIGFGRLPTGVLLSSLAIDPLSHLRSDGSPAAPTSLLITATGPNYFRSWRAQQDGSMVEMPILHPKREAGAVFVAHAWLSMAANTGATVAAGLNSAMPPGVSAAALPSISSKRERRVAAVTDAGTVFVVCRQEADAASNTLSKISGSDLDRSVTRAQAPTISASSSGPLQARVPEVWEVRSVIDISSMLQPSSAPGASSSAALDASGVRVLTSPSRLSSGGVKSFASPTSFAGGGEGASCGASTVAARSLSATQFGFMIGSSAGRVLAYEISDSTVALRQRAQLSLAAASGSAATAAPPAAAGSGSRGVAAASAATSPALFVCVAAFDVATQPDIHVLQSLPSGEAALLLSPACGVGLIATQIEETSTASVPIPTPLHLLHGAGAHTAAVAASASCLTQQRMLTSGADGQLRVWNYVQGRSEASLDLAAQLGQDELGMTLLQTIQQDVGGSSVRTTGAFAEGARLGGASVPAAAPPAAALMGVGASALLPASRASVTATAVAWHPGGGIAALVMAGRLFLLYTCATSLQLWKAMDTRGVRCAKYSKYGAYLAVAADTRVFIYHSLTMELIHTLTAHTATVRDVAWSLDEMFLCTCGDDGGVNLWSVRTGRRLEAFSNCIRGVKFACVVMDSVGTRDAATQLRTAESGGGAPALGGSSSSASPRHIADAPDVAADERAATGARNAGKSAGMTSLDADVQARMQVVAGLRWIVACGSVPSGGSVIVGCQLPHGSLFKVHLPSTELTSLALHPDFRCLYASTLRGEVRVYAWPVRFEAEKAMGMPSRRASVAHASVDGGGDAAAAAAFALSPGGSEASHERRRGSTGAPTPAQLGRTNSMASSAFGSESSSVRHDERGGGGKRSVADISITVEELITSDPLLGSIPEPTSLQYQLHTGSISSLHVTADGKYLVTTGSDAVVFVLGVPSRGLNIGGASFRGDDAGAGASWMWQPPASQAQFGVVQVSRAAYDESVAQLAVADAALKEARDNFLRRLAQANSDFASKQRVLTERAEKSIAAERSKYEALAARHDAYIRDSVAARERASADGTRALSETSNAYERRLASELQRYDELQSEVVAVRQLTEESLIHAERERRHQLQVLMSRAAQKQAELEATVTQLRAKLQSEQDRHEALLADAERDNEEMIARTKTQTALALAEEGSRSQAKQSEIVKLNKALSLAAKQLRTVEADVLSLRAEVAAKEARIDQLVEQNRSLQKLMAEQAELLSGKEKDIATIRAETRSLEGFRFVLDHRLAELDAQRAPVVDQIAELEAHLQSMYDEMVGNFHVTKSSDRELSALQSKLATITAALSKTRQTVMARQRLLENIVRDIERVAHGGDRELRDGVRELMTKYVSRAKDLTATADAAVMGEGEKTGKKGGASATAPKRSASPAASAVSMSGSRMPAAAVASEDAELIAELQRQRQQLMKGADLAARQSSLANDLASRKAEKLLQENLMLMEEANNLRKEVVYQRRQINRYEVEMGLRASGGVVGGGGGGGSSPSTTLLAHGATANTDADAGEHVPLGATSDAAAFFGTPSRGIPSTADTATLFSPASAASGAVAPPVRAFMPTASSSLQASPSGARTPVQVRLSAAASAVIGSPVGSGAGRDRSVSEKGIPPPSPWMASSQSTPSLPHIGTARR